MLPVRYAGEVIGALSLGRYEGSRPYTEDDVTYLQEFAATVDGFVGIARLLARLQRQSRVLEDVHDAVFAVDTVGAVTYWSRSAEDYFEIPAGDALGRPLADVLATTGEPADWLAHGWRELGRRGEWSDRVHLTSRSGRELDLDVRARTIVDVDGRPSGTVLVTHDVTELLGAYRQRERESAFAAAVLQSLPDATVVVDEQLHFIAGNNLYREQLEPFPEALEPGSDLLALADRLLAGVEDWPGIRAGLLDVAAGRQELLEAEMPLPTQPPQWIALQATWLPFEGGGLVLSEWDVTERKASEARLQRAATLDPLTRLANRDALLARLETALGRAAAARRSVGVMFVDLDRFKLVNDTLGHAAGDEVLVHTARVLRAHVRADDLVARLGGDEFVVVAEVADPHALDRLARRLVDALAEPVATRAGTAIGGASIGIRLLPPDEPRPHDPMALVDDADAAMFEAKSAGRNRHAWAHGGPGGPRADRPGA